MPAGSIALPLSTDMDDSTSMECGAAAREEHDAAAEDCEDAHDRASHEAAAAGSAAQDDPDEPVSPDTGETAPKTSPRKCKRKAHEPMLDVDALKVQKAGLKRQLRDLSRTVKTQQQKKRRLLRKASGLDDQDLLWILRQKQGK